MRSSSQRAALATIWSLADGKGPCRCDTLRAVPPRYDSKVALLVVDMQNDFADPQGSLFVKGAASILPLVNSETRLAREAGALVVYTQDWHPETTNHFAKDGGIWPVHCVGGTWGADFHPALDVDGPTIRKGTNGEDGYSGFSMKDPTTGATSPTELEAVLRERGIERVVVVGLATDYCVSATAIDAARLGFGTEVLQDAIASVDLEADDGTRAIHLMQAAGCTMGYCFGTLP
jgi:nicotinamidase/pyrazinamidase